MKSVRLIKGIGNINRIVRGQVIEWTESLMGMPNLIKDKIVYNKGDAPLYRVAFLIENNAKAVLLEKGGQNYHPLILLNDALMPAIAGIGKVSLAGKRITINCGKGIIYEGKVKLKEQIKPLKKEKTKVLATKTKVYVNVGYPTALEAAAKTRADGIGLLRTEFTAAKTLSKILNEEIFKGVTIKQAIEKSNEADVIYAIAKHGVFKKRLKDDLKETIIKAIGYFEKKEIIIRTFDIARDEDDPLGNRGIRRCISEGGYSLKILAESIKEALLKKGMVNSNIGVILPLVSHYSQIKAALDIILSSGLSLRKDGISNNTGIRFGWEIEQPAASQNNEIWLEAFRREYGQFPHFIGIGTNDLTQFTIALARDAYSKEKDQEVKKYLMKLYDETDFSVIRQIYEVSMQCRKVGIRLFLLGEAAARSPFTQLILSFGIIPSVAIDSVKKVKRVAYEFEKGKIRQRVIRRYLATVCDQYPSKVRAFLKSKLLQIILFKRR